MSIRATWIFTLQGGACPKLLFDRYFPTVERRVKLQEGQKYVSIPSNADMVEALSLELGLRLQNRQQFVESRDSCGKEDQKPVFELQTAQGKLWPLLIVEQYGLLYCCLPLVDGGSHTRPPLIQIPGISAGFSLLLGIADFLGPLPYNVDEYNTNFEQLHLFLGQAAPFGTPIDVNPHTVKAVLMSKPAALPSGQKQPAWKPVLYKGKPQLHFAVTEQIRAVQYDSCNVQDVWEVYGTVTCKAEFDSPLVDITVSLAHAYDSTATPLDHLTMHPCVQSADTDTMKTAGPKGDLSTGKSGVMQRKLRFTPPTEMFALCHYTANSLSELPLKGFYQMKGETTVDILVQLKLSPRVKNSFEYCEVQMSFFHRGAILNHECSPSHGSVGLLDDKKILVWNIGQKFPSKTLEVLLKATLHFGKYTPSTGNDDQFCVGQNSYAQVYFKINDFTHSGCLVDTKALQVTPQAKYKLTSVREYLSSAYKIWNSHGDVQTAFQPPVFITQDSS